MDAAALSVIVTLANGEIRAATVFPLGSVQRCQEARQNMAHGSIAKRYLPGPAPDP